MSPVHLVLDLKITYPNSLALVFIFKTFKENATVWVFFKPAMILFQLKLTKQRLWSWVQPAQKPLERLLAKFELISYLCFLCFCSSQIVSSRSLLSDLSRIINCVTCCRFDSFHGLKLQHSDRI